VRGVWPEGHTSRPFWVESAVAEPQILVVTAEDEGSRLDRFLVECLGAHSRSWWQRRIRAGDVLVNGRAVKTGYALDAGDQVSIQAAQEPPPAIRPVDLPLDVLYEDDEVIVVSKSAGLVVHPPGPSELPTLAGALLARYGVLADASGPLRPGIVHRLDRDTSGVIIVARNDTVHAFLSRQFAERRVGKTYVAVVLGVVEYDEDIVSAPLARHPRRREMVAVSPDGREAQTRCRVVERFDGFTLMELHPSTGRTHQIRVHMAHLGHPVAGDALYGRGPVTAHEVTGRGDEAVMARQALHAFRLEIDLPGAAGRRVFEAPWPDDFSRFVALLRRHRRRG